MTLKIIIEVRQKLMRSERESVHVSEGGTHTVKQRACWWHYTSGILCPA